MMTFSYFLLHICVIVACILLAMTLSIPLNGWVLVCFSLLYFAGKEMNIAFLRLLGYHPQAQMKILSAGVHRLKFLIFVKTEPDYAQLYASRHKGYQLLFTFLRFLLWGLFSPVSLVGWLLMLPSQLQGFLGGVFLLGLIFIAVNINEQLQKRFPKWFGLEVILVEREWPIFRKKE